MIARCTARSRRLFGPVRLAFQLMVKRMVKSIANGLALSPRRGRSERGATYEEEERASTRPRDPECRLGQGDLDILRLHVSQIPRLAGFSPIDPPPAANRSCSGPWLASVRSRLSAALRRTQGIKPITTGAFDTLNAPVGLDALGHTVFLLRPEPARSSDAIDYIRDQSSTCFLASSLAMP